MAGLGIVKQKGKENLPEACVVIGCYHGGGSLSGDGCCGLCTYALSCKKSQQSIKKKQKTKNLSGAQDVSSQAPCVVVGCYGSDGGGSGHGRCGQSYKKGQQSKKKKETYQRLKTTHLKPLAFSFGATEVVVVVVAMVVVAVLWW